MYKSIAFATLLLGLAMFASCSSDDEPTGKSGEEQVAYLRDWLLDEDGEISYPQSSTSGVYLLPATQEKFHTFTEAILDDKWDGKSQNYTLADNKGYIKIVSAPKEGVYVSLSFAVEGIPSFTLEIASEQYCENENLVVHRPTLQYGKFLYCTNCGYYKKVERREGDERPLPTHCPLCRTKLVVRLE